MSHAVGDSSTRCSYRIRQAEWAPGPSELRQVAHIQRAVGVLGPDPLLVELADRGLRYGLDERQRSGSCQRATVEPRKSRSSSTVVLAPSRMTTVASGRSPQRSSGTPTTQAS